MSQPKSRFRRTYLAARRGLGAAGRIALAGAATGAGTYVGLRLASPLFRGAARGLRSPMMKGRFGTLAASTRRLGKRGSALEWALPTAALTIGAKSWDEAKGAGKRRYKRWLHRGR